MSATPNLVTAPFQGFPKVFVSYSWDDERHGIWVRDGFTNPLRRLGVDAVMDVHGLTYGDDIDQFMEAALECDHIAIICTPRYAERANRGVGGVGYEKAIIRRFIERKVPPGRVVPIIRKGGMDSVPTFLATLVYADMRDDGVCVDVLVQLASLFYGREIHPAAPAVQQPDWLTKQFESPAGPMVLAEPDA